MARRKDRRGSIVATVLERLNFLFERLCTALIFTIAYMVSWAASLLACLFAAEVAVGRRVTRRDAEPARRALAANPAPLNTAAGRGVEIFGPSSGPCPDTGAPAAGHRARKRAYGYFRCIHFPSCKLHRTPSRISNISVQDWLKLNQPSNFQPPQRRPRGS